jgi:phosphoribosyl-ATP pyrophosphohydrolase/phosphoribosyl-AMP cyclohydrolase
MSREKIRGISGQFIDDPKMDIMKLKSSLSVDGIKMDNFAPDLKWSDLKPNIDGIIPVIAQDYRTDEVLMLGYMNQEAFNTTINSGRMTYYNAVNKSIYVMGEEEGRYQYVKGLCADCNYGSVLAKVSTVGVFPCEEAKSAFVHNIVQKQYTEKNPLKVLESVYAIIEDRKVNPKADSYTNHLFQKGMDEILKKITEECTEILLATKNGDSESIKYEISDFLYYCMILMVEKGITWEEITNELAQR